MFVIVAGGGRTGSTLARLLIEQKHEVRLVEGRKQVLGHLHRELPTGSIYEGNAANPHILEDAGIARANVVAACMPEDADNLAICFLARSRHGVRRTIACINQPEHAWLFNEKFHVDVALNQAEILASLIEEEMSLGDMMTLLKLRRGRYSLVEEKIPPTSKAVGRAIQEIGLPSRAVIAAVIRHGEIVIPRGSLRFEAGDEVLAICDPEAGDELARIFSG